jgi:hypothetical protein|eukprot:COSAG01_NODE_1231_length_11111_cov_37.001816_3_plen_67_part_00
MLIMAQIGGEAGDEVFWITRDYVSVFTSLTSANPAVLTAWRANETIQDCNAGSCGGCVAANLLVRR